jgi:Histidine phosphatase superfamily (branch 1)
MIGLWGPLFTFFAMAKSSIQRRFSMAASLAGTSPIVVKRWLALSLIGPDLLILERCMHHLYNVRRETATPVAAAHGLTITTDDHLIEAANIFEGQKFEMGSGVLKHPKSWRYLTKPWVPSWGEPYEEQVERMLAALFAARDAAGGRDALCVSHQLPIWILRSAVEGRRMMHDPRKRECTLASVTSFHLDSDGLISGTSYTEPAKHLLPKK